MMIDRHDPQVLSINNHHCSQNIVILGDPQWALVVKRRGDSSFVLFWTHLNSHQSKRRHWPRGTVATMPENKNCEIPKPCILLDHIKFRDPRYPSSSTRVLNSLRIWIRIGIRIWIDRDTDRDPILSNLIQSYPNLILSNLILFNPIQSYSILSYPILSYPILSNPIQSYLIQS